MLLLTLAACTPPDSSPSDPATGPTGPTGTTGGSSPIRGLQAIGTRGTLTASWQKIFSGDPAVGYWTQHHKYLAAKNAGKTSFGAAKNAHQLDEVIRNTFIQGTLSILFALVVVIVFVAGVVVAVKVIRGGGRPLTEEHPVSSKRFAPSGLIPTSAEREVQRQWDSRPASIPGSVGSGAVSTPP